MSYPLDQHHYIGTAARVTKRDDYPAGERQVLVVIEKDLSRMGDVVAGVGEDAADDGTNLAHGCT